MRFAHDRPQGAVETSPNSSPEGGRKTQNVLATESLTQGCGEKTQMTATKVGGERG